MGYCLSRIDIMKIEDRLMNVDESFNWDVSMKAIENEGIKLNFPLIGNPADKINL